MYWDRFDICETWFLALSHCYSGQWSDAYRRLCKLTRPGFFRPSPSLCLETLNENTKMIYDNACKKLLGD